MRHHLPILGLLALTQITGWGAVGVLPVLAGAMAALALLLQLNRLRGHTTSATG